jgi:hypothetical protein
MMLYLCYLYYLRILVSNSISISHDVRVDSQYKDQRKRDRRANNDVQTKDWTRTSLETACEFNGVPSDVEKRGIVNVLCIYNIYFVKMFGVDIAEQFYYNRSYYQCLICMSIIKRMLYFLQHVFYSKIFLSTLEKICGTFSLVLILRC